MNAKAVALGLASTFFTTPHGLPASRGQHEDRSTALDLARLGREAITHETLMTWCGTERTRFPNSVGLIVNSNRLLGSGGVDGLKTGFTNRAGFCLIASAEREGRRFVCAILGGRTSRARYDMASALFDLAMESERRVVLAGARRGIPPRCGAVQPSGAHRARS